MGSFQFALALLLALLGLPLTKFNRGIEEVAFQFIHFILVQYCPLTNLCQPRAAVVQIWRVTHVIPSLSSYGQLAVQAQAFAVFLEPAASGGPFTDQCFLCHFSRGFGSNDQTRIG